MNDKIIYIIILIILAYVISFGNSFIGNKNGNNQSYTIPPEYKGAAGLDYLKKQYSSDLSQARSLCTGQFKGKWIDTADRIGCYSMQGFSSFYCGMSAIKNLVDICKSIGGSPVCSSNQASCSV